MKINQIINEGLVFYAKNPDGTKTYSLVKDAEHLANLEQKYRGAQVQKLDFARQDVQDWLDSRGVNLRRFPPGMETTVGPNQGRPADEPTQPQNVVWRAPGYKPGKGSPFDTSGSTLVKRTNFPAKDDVMAEGDGDHQIRPGMKVSQGTVVKVDGNTVTVKTSNGDLMTMNIHDVQQGMAEGMVKGEYGRVLDALQLYYPRLSMDELNVPGYHKVVADKANVPVEYAAQVINDFTRDNDPDEDEFDDDEQGVAEGDLNEFARGGNGDNDDRGEDPYGRPEPKHYSRSVDYFGRFEADHFDQEDMDDATGVFKGYWDYDGDMKQIAYFKFDDPARTGSDDPGMGWYYEPQNESVAEGIDDEEYGPELDALKKEFGKFTQHYDRMDQDSAYAAQWRKQNTDRLNREVPDDDGMGDIGDEMGQDDEDSIREGKPKEKEADYGADYQDMVSRVKKLAGLGPLKTVYDPQKRVYKNVPTAVQPKKEQR